MYGYGLGYRLKPSQGTGILSNLSRKYFDRVTTDGGNIDSQVDIQSYISMAKANGIYDSILFGMLGAYNIRTSGNTKYVTKAYSLDSTPNDATQTTEASQPFLSGFIAPNEKWGLKNPNGATRYMTHPTISFAANEAFTISTVLSDNSFSANDSGYCGGSVSVFKTKTGGGNNYGCYTGTNGFNSIYSSLQNIGKGTIVTWVRDSFGVGYLYLNGEFIENGSLTGSIDINRLMSGRGYYVHGSIPAHIIRNVALTPSQAISEYNWFKNRGYLGYEGTGIVGVKIGEQVFSSSNFEAVATPMGNSIANVTDNTAWSNSQATYDSVYAATVGTDEQKTYAAVKAAAAWCYYNNDASLGAIYGKLYNWFAVKLLQMDIDYYNAANPTTPWGWNIPIDVEINTLEETVDYNADALKEATENFWGVGNTGTNTTGLTVLPAGYRDVDGTFNGITETAIFGTVDSDIDNRIGVSLRLIKD